MKKHLGVRLVKVAVPVAAVATLLFLSPAARDRIITTAHAAAQRVLVVNKDNRPVPVSPVQELFQERVQIGMNHTATFASADFQVPAGVRLVLENLGGKGAAEGINFVEVGQVGGSAFLRPTLVNLTGTWKWIGTTPTKVVFEAGSVSVQIRRPSAQSACTTCTAFSYITLTGYLVEN